MSSRHTRYATFGRLVRAQYMVTAAQSCFIRQHNSASMLGGNVAVNHTIWGRKSRWEFNTTWHSSITIRSNRRVHRSRFKNIWKSGLTTDSGVTNTMDAASGGRQLSHGTHDMPSSWHRLVISARNATSGTTTMV
ncbi:hypothetical protein KXX06_005232, partial [Aspergillus fumigatus]